MSGGRKVNVGASRYESPNERLIEFQGWAYSRIQHCRDIEARFSYKSAALVEAVAERRALQAALEILAPGWLGRVDAISKESERSAGGGKT